MRWWRGLRAAVLAAVLVAAGPVLPWGTGEGDGEPGTASPGRLVAQQTGQEEQVDTAELRIRERLRRLARPPGADTIPLDSLSLDSLAAAAAGRRPTPRGRERGETSASDSTVAALLQALEGYERTEYRGKRAVYQAGERELFLYADSMRRAELQRPQGDRLAASDVIVFEQGTGAVEALGQPAFTPAGGDEVASQRLVFDTRRGAGSAYDADTRYQQPGTGTDWNVSGDLPLVTADLAYGDHARFTSCDLEVPHYHFETDQLKIVQGNVLVARPVKLYFADVPVAWLPFVFQSLTRGRGSGILAPRFSVNDIVRTSGGYRRRVSNIGFYWAISDYMDATVAMDWFDDNYTALTGNFRYRWLRQFLQGNLSFRQYWRAAGGTETALNTQQSWQMSERTSLNVSGQWTSSTAFVRRNSFDPREVTQEIRSQGGLQRRFDWGNLSVSADRAQSLSDDRVTMSLPRLNLSISPITLFEAPSSRARWYNNITWNGSARLSRQVLDRPTPEQGFTFSTADKTDLDVGMNSSLTIGALSLSQSLTLRDEVLRDVPASARSFVPGPIPAPLPAFMGEDEARGALQEERFTDLGTRELDWSLSTGYQQNLIGTTTLTPSLSLSGQARQVDSLEVAQELVAAPTRVTFGATLKADVYGFYGGVGSYEAIRHKLTPSFTYNWSPEVEPTDLQRQVFGSTTLQPRSTLSIGINQTWEAKRPLPEGQGEQMAGAAPADSLPGDSIPAVAVQDSAQADPGPVDLGGEEDEPRRLERGEIVNLLSLNTQAINYDFVQADSTGQFLQGFTTTQIRNQISSDFLRGLTLSMTHDLWDDRPAAEGDGIERSFSPHLSRLNFSFSLNQRSTLIRWLGLGGDPSTASAAPEEEPGPGTDDPFAQRSATDEAGVMPGTSDDTTVRSSRGTGGPWQANFSYSLNRPRRENARVSQLLNMNLSMSPTENWELRWTTSYDVEETRFNDHRVRLTRDLHRWQAHFDFLKTATGNWTFRFEVSLLDNQDLHFDYEQRSLQVDER